MTQLNYKEIDEWIENIPLGRTFYAKKCQTYPYISVLVSPKGDKKVYISGTQNRKICDVGFFDKKQGGFEALWNSFKASDKYRSHKALIDDFISENGFPSKEETGKTEEKEVEIAKKRITPEKDENKKMSYSEIDKWIMSLPVDNRTYTKLIPNFPYILVNVKASTRLKEIWFVNPKTKKRVEYIGSFGPTKSEALFAALLKFIEANKNSVGNYQRSYQWIIDLYGLPRQVEPESEEEQKEIEKIDEQIAKLEKEKEIAKEKEKEKLNSLKAIPDDVKVDYPLFINCKNQYNIKRASKSYFKQKAIFVTIYMIISIAIITLFFNSEFFKNSHFLPNAFAIIFFMILFALGLSKMGDFFQKKHDDAFRELSRNSHLKDEEHYNAILELMVKKAVKKLTAYGTKEPLLVLLNQNSSYIPDDVYELKNKAKLDPLTFLNLLSEETREELLEKYLEDQKVLARIKAVDLLEKIKKEDNLALLSPLNLAPVLTTNLCELMDSKVKNILKAKGEKDG